MINIMLMELLRGAEYVIIIGIHIDIQKKTAKIVSDNSERMKEWLGTRYTKSNGLGED